MSFIRTMDRKYIAIFLVLITLVEITWYMIDNVQNIQSYGKQAASSRPDILEDRRQSKNHRQNSMGNTLSTSIDTTVVTAYFDIGTFRKGRPGHFFTPSLYYKWANIFEYLKNPLIIYTDSQDFKHHMLLVRNNSIATTRIHLIERSSIWAFENIDRIKKIFNSGNYPKHYPNTVVPGYACAQHAKYAVIELAATTDTFKTEFFMWLDIGYFRERSSKKPFILSKPKGFNQSKIAMNLIMNRPQFSIQPEEVFKRNLVLVGGGLVFGTRTRLLSFADQFRRAVTFFLSRGFTSTDQQIIYAMFTTRGRQMIKTKVELQMYRPPKASWFYLGYSMLTEINI